MGTSRGFDEVYARACELGMADERDDAGRMAAQEAFEGLLARGYDATSVLDAIALYIGLERSQRPLPIETFLKVKRTRARNPFLMACKPRQARA